MYNHRLHNGSILIVCMSVMSRYQTLRRTRRCVTSWWVATTSTCRPSTTQPSPGEMSSCVLPQHLTTPLRWWNTLLVRTSSILVQVHSQLKCKIHRLNFPLIYKTWPPLFSVFPLQRGWCTHGRRSACRWSLTPQQSAPSASSRCTSTWWASEKNRTSTASATWSQPAHNTTYYCWLEMAHVISTPIPLSLSECINYLL